MLLHLIPLETTKRRQERRLVEKGTSPHKIIINIGTVDQTVVLHEQGKMNLSPLR